jgi:putative peptidoglycan lipid II flippase
MIKLLNKMPNIVKAVGVVTIISALGKILGFVREAIIAAYFGTSGTADVFFVANIIPTILYTAIGIAIYSGIIPIYVEEKEKSQAKADEVMSVLGTVFFLIAVAIAVVSFVFAGPIVKIVAPGFNEEQLKLTEQLTKIMLPGIAFLALTTISTGVLNSHKKFVAPSLTATAQNLVIILSTVLLADKFGVQGLAVGVLLGAAAQFFIQYPQMSKYDIRFNFSFRKEKKRIKDTMIMFYPIIVASLAVQINGITDRMISSGLGEGSVSALNYANKLMMLPLSVIMSPLITVLYPSIVESAIKSLEQFIELVIKGAKTIIFLSIPFVAVMVICGEDLIELAFKRGAFDESATNQTVIVFVFYSLGLVFFALRDYLMNCLYALKETRRAMYTSILMVIANVILSFTLSRFFNASGVALAASLATLLQTLFLTYYLWKRTNPSTDLKSILFKDIFKLTVSFLLILICLFPIYKLLGDHLNNFFQIAIITIVTFALFFGFSFLLKIKEAGTVLKLFKKES